MSNKKAAKKNTALVFESYRVVQPKLNRTRVHYVDNSGKLTWHRSPSTRTRQGKGAQPPRQAPEPAQLSRANPGANLVASSSTTSASSSSSSSGSGLSTQDTTTWESAWDLDWDSGNPDGGDIILDTQPRAETESSPEPSPSVYQVYQYHHRDPNETKTRSDWAERVEAHYQEVDANLDRFCSASMLCGGSILGTGGLPMLKVNALPFSLVLTGRLLPLHLLFKLNKVEHASNCLKCGHSLCYDYDHDSTAAAVTLVTFKGTSVLRDMIFPSFHWNNYIITGAQKIKVTALACDSGCVHDGGHYIQAALFLSTPGSKVCNLLGITSLVLLFRHRSHGLPTTSWTFLLHCAMATPAQQHTPSWTPCQP